MTFPLRHILISLAIIIVGYWVVTDVFALNIYSKIEPTENSNLISLSAIVVGLMMSWIGIATLCFAAACYVKPLQAVRVQSVGSLCLVVAVLMTIGGTFKLWMMAKGINMSLLGATDYPFLKVWGGFLVSAINDLYLIALTVLVGLVLRGSNNVAKPWALATLVLAVLTFMISLSIGGAWRYVSSFFTESVHHTFLGPWDHVSGLINGGRILGVSLIGGVMGWAFWRKGRAVWRPVGYILCGLAGLSVLGLYFDGQNAAIIETIDFESMGSGAYPDTQASIAKLKQLTMFQTFGTSLTYLGWAAMMLFTAQHFVFEERTKER